MSANNEALQSTSENNPNKRMPCPLFGCKRVYTDVSSLESHINDHEIPAQSIPGKVLLCSIIGCSGSFPNMKKLMEHMRHHHKPNMFFLCENCRAKLRSYRGLLTHLHTCSKVPRGKMKTAEMTGTQPVPDAGASISPTTGGLPANAEQETPMQDSASNPPPVPSHNTTAEHSPAAQPGANATAASHTSCLPNQKSPTASSSLQSQQSAEPPSQPEANYSATSQRLENQTCAATIPRTQFQVDPQSNSQPQGGSPQLFQHASVPSPQSTRSTAVLRKNQGFPFNIQWEYCRGQYRCLLCGHAVSTRREINSHINYKHWNPPPGKPTDETVVDTQSNQPS